MSISGSYLHGGQRYYNTGDEFISLAPALCSDVNDTCETVSRVAAVHMLRSIQAVRTVAAPTHVITRRYTITNYIFDVHRSVHRNIVL